MPELPDKPHFAIPFRFEGDHVAVNEQDSSDEILGCVEVITRTTVSERETMPDFGVVDFTFETDKALMRSMLTAAIDEFEPRVQQLVESADLPTDDTLLERLRLLISPVDETEEGAL